MTDSSADLLAGITTQKLSYRAVGFSGKNPLLSKEKDWTGERKSSGEGILAPLNSKALSCMEHQRTRSRLWRYRLPSHRPLEGPPVSRAATGHVRR